MEPKRRGSNTLWGVLFIGVGVLVVIVAVLKFLFSGSVDSVADDFATKVEKTAAELASTASENIMEKAKDWASVERGEILDQGTKTFDASGFKHLDINNLVGEVEVKADPNAKEVSLTYKKYRIERLGLLRGNRDPDSVQVEFEQRGEIQYIRTDRSGTSELFAQEIAVDYELTVPPTLELSVEVSAGDVETKGMENNITVTANAGNIIVNGFKGKLDAESNAGTISIRGGKEIDKLRADSNAGSIQLSLRDDANVTIDASTNVGSIDGKAFDLSVDRDVTNASLHDKIGNGDGNVELLANAGSIKILKEQ